MEPSLRTILDELSDRVHHTASTIASKFHELPSSSQDQPLLERLPYDLLDSFNSILELFEQTSQERQTLSNELFQTYNILNTTFDTTLAVANCQTARHAIETLCDKISQSISTGYTLVIGPLSSHFDSPFHLVDPNDQSVTGIADLTPDPSLRAPAFKFVQDHAQDLLVLFKSNQDCLVKMIDYKGDADLDHDGRGNVMLVHLSGSHDELSQSALLFIRNDSQEPFVAVEMNLANSLCSMCSAVMGNIIFAEKLNRSFVQTIASLVRAMEAKDEYTCGHSNRVSDIACEIGRHMGFDHDRINQLQWAGLLHDIGKIGIHEDILCKPGRLTDDEYKIIKTHPDKSYKVLEPVEALKEILPAVRHHHEHFDGSGYPDKLAGDNIPLIARIIQVADIWDALTSTRSYRKAMPADKAISILEKEAGTTMDPNIVRQFIHMLDNHPEWLPVESPD